MSSSGPLTADTDGSSPAATAGESAAPTPLGPPSPADEKTAELPCDTGSPQGMPGGRDRPPAPQDSAVRGQLYYTVSPIHGTDGPPLGPASRGPVLPQNQAGCGPVLPQNQAGCGPVLPQNQAGCGPVLPQNQAGCGPVLPQNQAGCGPVLPGGGAGLSPGHGGGVVRGPQPYLQYSTGRSRSARIP